MKKFVVVMLLIPTIAFAQNVRTFIPPKAFDLIPLITSETKRYMPDYYDLGYIPALVEQESCISLKHSRCWDPRSELKSKHERGLGIGQITVAYDSQGRVRFDKLAEMRAQYKEELRELSWLTLKERPDLQVRTMVLMIRDLYRGYYAVKDPLTRYHFVDAAYNGGPGGVKKERTACGLAKDCNPQLWFGHVERYCLKSKKPLYGNRNACDINREHVTNVFKIRINKYRMHIRDTEFKDVLQY